MDTELLQSESDRFTEWAADNWHTKEEKIIIESAKLAYQNDDRNFLDGFEALGPSPRHRVMNLHAYQRGLLFGWTHTNLNENNWLHGHAFEKEIIPFVTKIDGDKNNIEIGRSPNGKYTTGRHFNYGNGGSYSSCSIYGRIFNSRDEAMDHAIADAKEFYYKELNGNNFDNDKALIKQVLAAIEKQISSSKQLNLF